LQLFVFYNFFLYFIENYQLMHFISFVNNLFSYIWSKKYLLLHFFCFLIVILLYFIEKLPFCAFLLLFLTCESLHAEKTSSRDGCHLCRAHTVLALKNNRKLFDTKKYKNVAPIWSWNKEILFKLIFAVQIKTTT
jgi:hypothetical protein